ncbi:MAG: flagellar hook-basal body complex protein FliE [Opitutus sp.]|nr:flagellar hook-basal body complex protein FliE [Opitutus sp.]MCS6247886.1 flagellar hook-basal body complex protein FliE [Opitutus sp.]MCS6273399.1 flagellar hook-basal body complex protein FliE [Opitutus sp.]MCS6277465.1 flagellar hook-basal body complex protein FliE [Opitutus sp.]MCS6300582.1 flagellar hook-basal body complex protein FliE [Opitutus sp.]
MALIGAALPISAQSIRPQLDLAQVKETFAPKTSAGAPPAGGGFGDIFNNLITDVEQRQAKASEVTRSVLMGDNPNLHQSVIAMQEASLSFGLMVEVRNKVVESYQELMRMPV